MAKDLLVRHSNQLTKTKELLGKGKIQFSGEDKRCEIADNGNRNHDFRLNNACIFDLTSS